LERRRGIVRSEGRAHRFDHQQVLDVLYTELPEELRSEYHTLIADILEDSGTDDPVLLAHHHLRGRDPARGLPHVDRAVERLVASLRSEEAVDLIERALAAPGVCDSTRCVDLHLRVGRIFDRLGRRDEQFASATAALQGAERLGDRGRLAASHRALGVHAFTTHDVGEAVKQLTRAMEIFEGLGQHREVIDLTRRLGAARLRGREYDAARLLLERASAAAADLGDGELEGLALRTLGNLHAHQFRYDEALACATRACALLERAGAMREVASAHSLCGTANWMSGRVAEAKAAYGRCLAIAEQTQDRHLEVNSRGRLGLISLHGGYLADALRQFRHHREGGLEIGDAAGVGQSLANLAQTYSLLGDLPSALDCAERTTQIAAVLDNPRMASFGHALCAALHRYGGDLEQALSSVEAALEWAQTAGDRAAEGAAYVEMAELALVGEDPARALQLANRAAEIASETGNTALLAVTTLRLAELGAASAADIAPLYAQVEPNMASFLKLSYLLSLWELSGDAALLEEAAAILDHLIAHAPLESRVLLVQNNPIHRAVAAARNSTL
jgi:tetratricopeptide (TPR) repeat protein